MSATSTSNVTTGMYVNLSTGETQSGHIQFRNRIINGDMRINQRGTSTTLASMTAVGTTFGYVADRWGVYRGGYATGAQMGQGTNLSTSDQPFIDTGTKTYARVSRISGNTGTADINLAYGLESQDSQALINKYVTLSFYYRTGANFSGTSLTSRIVTGTGTDEGYQRGSTITGGITYTQINNTSTNWSYVSQTALLGANINQVGVYIYYTPSGTAGANDYFDITCIQLEKGTQATSFEVRPYALEYRLCMRYYLLYNFNGCMTRAGANGFMRCNLPEIMRIQPTSMVTGLTVDWSSVVSATDGTATPESASLVRLITPSTGTTTANFQGSHCTVSGVRLDAEL